MAGSADGQSGAPVRAATPDESVPIGTLLTAGMRLLAALRKSAAALLELLVAEAEVSKASVALIFLACIALVAFAVALWVCVVALVGWALASALHSVGAALAVLVGIHVLLAGGTFLLIRHMIRRATFPLSRAELAALRGTVQRDFAKFHDATAAPAPDPSP